MRTRLTSLAVALVATLVFAPAAWGEATFTVTSTTPSGGACPSATTCTLAAAIAGANAVTSGDDAPTINFNVGSATIEPTANLPAITRDGTFVDGCNVGRSTPQSNDPPQPNPPASDPCVGLRAAGTATYGLQVKDAGGVVIQGLAITKFDRGVHLWGADRTGIGGNWFGLRIDGTTAEGNHTAISVTGRVQNGALQDPATSNRIGDTSDATDTDLPACDKYCNVIVNSTVAGVDLGGAPTPPTGAGDAPAGGACENDPNFTCGNFISGNWIGVASFHGTPAAPNETAVTIGNSLDTQIGGDYAGDGNVIAGNAKGVDQGAGTNVAWLIGGVYGISPDSDRSVPNGSWNARLRGSAGRGSVVDKAVFGPSDIGLDLEGATAHVTGSSFFSPDSARFTTAAIYVAPGADNAFIGSAAGALAACAPLLDNCNSITHTGPGAAGIWVDGADDARIQRNSIGATLLAYRPLDGPPIRVDGGAVGARIGDDDDDPDARNVLVRASGAGIQIGGGATRIAVGDNEGFATDGGTLLTDLIPGPGLGNTGPENGGVQPPVITLATTNGVGGTGTAGATVRVLQQQRAPVQGDPDPTKYPAGYTFPTTPSVTTVRPDGIWGVAFATPLKTGQKLLASQTTGDGSSEYAPPQAAAADNPAPIVTFTSGPPTIVDASVRTATFAFKSSKLGSSFQCSLDGGSFVACSSPYTVNGLETGGHQLQVKATDPIGKQGPPASRTWSILFADPAPAPGPTGSSAKAVKFASVVTLPSARKCISKRSLKITVRAPKGARLKSTVVRIGSRRVASVKNVKTIPVSLKGLARGSFVVRVTVTLTDGRVIKGSRTYRTCAKKAARKKSSKKKPARKR